MKKIKVVVSGLGRIAWQYHLPMLARDQRFEILAVADPSTERLKEAADTYSFLRTYNDFHAMLEAERSADMAVIASPTMFHLPQAVDAVAHSLAVFLEKPMCESLTSAQKLFDCVEQHNGKLMLYQPHRTRRETQTLKNLALNKLGTINHVRRTLSFFNRRNDWQSRKECGGGMLNNYGAHYVDQFMYVFGADELKVKGCIMQRTVGIGDAEDLVNILLENKQNVTCNLEINLGSAVNIDSWDVYGTCGCAHWDKDLDHWLITYVEPGTLPEMTMQQTLAAQDRSYSLEKPIPWITEKIMLDSLPVINYYDHVYEYFTGNAPALVTLDESMILMKTLNTSRNIAEGK